MYIFFCVSCFPCAIKWFCLSTRKLPQAFGLVYFFMGHSHTHTHNNIENGKFSFLVTIKNFPTGGGRINETKYNVECKYLCREGRGYLYIIWKPRRRRRADRCSQTMIRVEILTYYGNGFECNNIYTIFVFCLYNIPLLNILFSVYCIIYEEGARAFPYTHITMCTWFTLHTICCIIF